MKKTLSILLAAVMVFTFSACSIKKIERDEDGNVIEPSKQKSYADMTFEEKLAYMSQRERDFVAVDDSGLLAPACELNSSEYGYINNLGDWVIQPEYAYAYSFNEGYAPVLDKYTDYEFVDSQGVVLTTNVSRKITMKASRHFYEHFVAAVFDTGYEQTKMYLGLDGVTQINASKLPTVKGNSYSSKNYFAVATPYYMGSAAVMRKTNASIVEKNGIEKAQSKNLLESAYVINTLGSVEATLPAGLDIYDYSMNANGTITVQNALDEFQRFGVCNFSGELIIPCDYYLIEYCENDLYMAADANGFFGFIDSTGKKVIDFKYTAALAFSEGLAAVCDGTKWGFINTSGDFVIAPSFDDVAGLKKSDEDVNVNVGAFCDGIASVRFGDYWALIDTKCKIIDAVYAPGYEESPYSCVANGFVVYTEFVDGIGQGCGLLDLAGNEVLEPKYMYIGKFSE